MITPNDFSTLKIIRDVLALAEENEDLIYPIFPCWTNSPKVAISALLRKVRNGCSGFPISVGEKPVINDLSYLIFNKSYGKIIKYNLTKRSGRIIRSPRSFRKAAQNYNDFRDIFEKKYGYELAPAVQYVLQKGAYKKPYDFPNSHTGFTYSKLSKN